MKPWENPYFEEDYENPDCDCYGCATMRHECWYDYIERKKKRRNKKMRMTYEYKPKCRNCGKAGSKYCVTLKNHTMEIK